MSHNAVLAVISLLAEKWPWCFSIIESGRRPLKLGIRDDVLNALGGAISAGKVSAALRWYVSSPEYQRRLVHGAWRVDLNGKPAGIVSRENEAHDRAQLPAIEAKRTECASASLNSAPAPNLTERMKETSQAEQRNVPPAARLPPKPTTPPAPAKPLTLKDVRGKRLAEHAEQRSRAACRLLTFSQDAVLGASCGNRT
jgi:ProP effector